jgi:hypothetical protein
LCCSWQGFGDSAHVKITTIVRLYMICIGLSLSPFSEFTHSENAYHTPCNSKGEDRKDEEEACPNIVIR